MAKTDQEIKKQKSYSFAVYGLEKIGFAIPDGHIITNDIANITFLKFKSETPLDSFTGVIVPSGIFESFTEQFDLYGDKGLAVYCDRDTLLQKQREILNLVNNGGWVCCLVGKIKDFVKAPGYATNNCKDTDLVKILLNTFDVDRKVFPGSASVHSTNDAFKKYIEQYGIAKTVLNIPYDNKHDYKVVAKDGDYTVGIDFLGNFIFLPFHTTNFSLESAEELVNLLTSSLTDYLLKRTEEVPDWVNVFEFEEEVITQKKIDGLIKDFKDLQQVLTKYKKFKGILTQSGDTLKDTVVFLLRTYFNLNVTDVEDFKEDAIIRDTEGNKLVVVEIKGTKGGIKRKHINQLDDNRERVGLNLSTPGLLIINDQMGVESIPERHETSVAEEQVAHSKNMNILLLRTIDLLYLIRIFEKTEDRKQKFIQLCMEGGGRLVADDKSFKIITQTSVYTVL